MRKVLFLAGLVATVNAFAQNSAAIPLPVDSSTRQSTMQAVGKVTPMRQNMQAIEERLAALDRDALKKGSGKEGESCAQYPLGSLATDSQTGFLLQCQN